MRITALERKPRRRSIDLYVDGEKALSLSADVCLQFGLSSGQEITPEDLAAIRRAESDHKAMASALRLLSYRQRSEREIRERLARKGVTADTVDLVVERLRGSGLLDDTAFAASFAESRDRTSPRSRRLIAAELQAKGVNGSVAEQSAEAIDEADAAYRAGSRRVKTLAGATEAEFRRRLGDFLLRRGFEYEMVEGTVRRLWREVEEAAADG